MNKNPNPATVAQAHMNRLMADLRNAYNPKGK